MADPRKERTSADVTPDDGPRKGSPRETHASRTEGTNRDYDESGESRNQGHSHPREEREGDEGTAGGVGGGGG
jgi:hypothetical protein